MCPHLGQVRASFDQPTGWATSTISFVAHRYFLSLIDLTRRILHYWCSAFPHISPVHQHLSWATRLITPFTVGLLHISVLCILARTPIPCIDLSIALCGVLRRSAIFCINVQIWIKCMRHRPCFSTYRHVLAFEKIFQFSVCRPAQWYSPKYLSPLIFLTQFNQTTLVSSFPMRYYEKPKKIYQKNTKIDTLRVLSS